MSLAWQVETSGLLQLLLGVLLGWPLYLHRGSAAIQRWLPARHRLQQAHLDDIAMGALQVLLASHVARGGPMLAVLFVFGSWTNAQIFMLLCLSDDRCSSRAWFRALALVSFTAVTFAYAWLFALQFIEMFRRPIVTAAAAHISGSGSTYS